MKKIGLIVVPLLFITIAATSCRKKEQPPPPAPEEMLGVPHGMMAGGPEKLVIVPDSVKGAWKAVKIEVEFKETKSTKQFSVPLDSEFQVPDSDLTVKVGDFLPHFSMTAESITSSSDNPENPAVRLEALEAGNLIFKGWLFAKFPDVHPLQHEKYGLKLIEGERK
jgi:hypothetical protein